ncbi:hypothetical protein ACHAWU_009809 [Discostella pseudostelligera]|uniref:Polynucleotide 5'-triphosphatase n=1 Tax=Discostella pseudostelligera TaxID=259834 RepID=A0ABD3M7V2_9STRA
MSSKRPALALGSLVDQSSKEAKRSATDRPASAAHHAASGTSGAPRNPFLSRPTQPEDAIKIFLIQARSIARRQAAIARNNNNATNIEIEARLGTLLSPFGTHDMRALPSGPKLVPIQGKERVAHAFICNVRDNVTHQSQQQQQQPSTNFEGGITRSNYLRWTQAGLSESSPLSASFSCRKPNPNESESSVLKSQLVEAETVTTVYTYPNHTRVNFAHDTNNPSTIVGPGVTEKKEKLSTIDMALPAAPYDLRLTCASETDMKHKCPPIPSVANVAPGWEKKRIKRRRSYSRADKSFAWKMDVTEVTTIDNPGPNHGASSSSTSSAHAQVGYEIEMELSSTMTQKLVSTQEDAAARKLAETLAQQLWFMVQQLNPTQDVLEVSDFLREHTNAEETRLAIGQCGSIKRFMESACQSWRTAIAPDVGGRAPGNEECLPPRNFIGSMPVNFSRHNIEEVQRSDGGYYLSEKTDGVRYLLVFTGKSAVLVDRASHETKKAFQPKPSVCGGENNTDTGKDPLHEIVSSIKPGAILDGEVVVHRKLRRPIFIVFDVLANSANEPILHLPFERRLQHLKAASFVRPGAGVDVFNPSAVSDPGVALPLVRKNFVDRVDLDRLLSHVVEERGARTYRYGDTHHHLTDGIIFQPNTPYICGTDVNLLKWKYLDTVTIDVEILPPRQNFGRNQSSHNDDDILRVGVMGEEGTTVDMTRYLRLPDSERHRLEADRHETGSKIAEVGFDPTTGEWYYRTMRPDKVAPNHISTVLGTLLELAESLSTEELRYRMSVPSGTRDSYTKDVRNMQKQLLEHQRRKNKASGSK